MRLPYPDPEGQGWYDIIKTDAIPTKIVVSTNNISLVNLFTSRKSVKKMKKIIKNLLFSYPFRTAWSIESALRFAPGAP